MERMLQAALLIAFAMGLDGHSLTLEIQKDNLWYKSYWQGRQKSAIPSTEISWKSHVPSAIQISSEDTSQSMAYGDSMLAEKDKITRNLKSKNMSLPRDSAAYLHQAIFRRSSPRSSQLSKKGYTMDQATSFLKNKLELRRRKCNL
ncbi:uncharacterized protein LOC125046707 [Penaeus chinensis]|uniref:uncharacterized protein LOC125046707 n=1 Tax=Penaeus chinensis TaxID=139456 RepID=UPI001FB6F735|nr:uncharacterized protein LOC125046707 [Penaeus chinensis]